MYTLQTTKQFEKDYKLCRKRGLNLDLINKVFELLEQTGSLPVKYKTHKLTGNYTGFLEGHIQGVVTRLGNKRGKTRNSSNKNRYS